MAGVDLLGKKLQFLEWKADLEQQFPCCSMIFFFYFIQPGKNIRISFQWPTLSGGGNNKRVFHCNIVSNRKVVFTCWPAESSWCWMMSHHLLHHLIAWQTALQESSEASRCVSARLCLLVLFLKTKRKEKLSHTGAFRRTLAVKLLNSILD